MDEILEDMSDLSGEGIENVSTLPAIICLLGILFG